MLSSGGIVQQKGTLPEIVQHESRKNEDEPRQPNRARAEVSHVGIQRFAAGHGQENSAENEKSVAMIRGKEPHRMRWIKRHQHVRFLHQMKKTECRDDHEPDEHHRPKHRADPRSPESLQKKKEDEHDDSHRYDERSEP